MDGLIATVTLALMPQNTAFPNSHLVISPYGHLLIHVSEYIKKYSNSIKHIIHQHFFLPNERKRIHEVCIIKMGQLYYYS